MVQDNGTDSHENQINNNNLSKHTWSKREIARLIAINTEERLKGYKFMQSLKKRWDEEFPEKTNYNTKGLHNNASRFKIERKGNRDLQNPLQIIKEPNK